MEILLDEKYNNKKLITNNNVILIYGPNAFGKTYFLNYLKVLISKKNKNLFSDLNIDNDRQIIEISEEWDLKKELSLSKTSSTRKFILKDTLKELEKNNIDLLSNFNSDDSLNLIKDHINKIIKIEEKKYFIKSDYSFKSDIDIIDHLFKLKIVDKDDNEINESIIPKSIKSQLFSKLLIESNSKNKIILFDCPETYLDNNYQSKFSNLINKLSSENLIISTYRDTKFLTNINFDLDKIYYLDKNLIINELFISNSILIQLYLLKNENFDSFNDIKTLKDFEQKKQDIEFVVTSDDFKKIKQDIFKKYISLFFKNLDLDKSLFKTKKLFYLTENEKLILILIAKYNDFSIEEINFKNNLFKKILEF